MEEIWKDIEGYEGLYQVSNLGNIKSLQRKNICGKTIPSKLLKPHENPQTKYLTVNLYKSGKSHTVSIHRLVAYAFVPNPHNLPQVGHKDESRNNNCANNLEWTTNIENSNTPKRKEKLSASLLGNKISEETKIKLSIKMKKRKGRKFLCDDLFFESLTDLSRYLQIPLTTLQHYANKDRRIPQSLPRFMEFTQKESNNV